MSLRTQGKAIGILMLASCPLCFGARAGGVASGPSQAKSLTAQLVRPAVTSDGITGLEAESQDVRLIQQKDGSLVAEIPGIWTSEPDSVLLHDSKPVPLTEIDPPPAQGPDQVTRKFTIELPVTGLITPVKVSTVDPFGRIHSEAWQVIFPDYPKLAPSNELAPDSTEKSAKGISLSLGISNQGYLETGIEPFEQQSLVLKAGGGIPLKDTWKAFSGWSPRWLFALSGYWSLPALLQVRPDPKVQYLGLNFRGGYEFPEVLGRVTFSLWGGFYFASMIVDAEDPEALFGFTGQIGPQILPSLRLRISKRWKASTYFKYSPLSDGVGFNWRDREIAAGGSIQFAATSSLTLSASLDVARLTTEIRTSWIESDSTSFSLGVGF